MVGLDNGHCFGSPTVMATPPTTMNKNLVNGKKNCTEKMATLLTRAWKLGSGNATDNGPKNGNDCCCGNATRQEREKNSNV